MGIMRVKPKRSRNVPFLRFGSWLNMTNRRNGSVRVVWFSLVNAKFQGMGKWERGELWGNRVPRKIAGPVCRRNPLSAGLSYDVTGICSAFVICFAVFKQGVQGVFSPAGVVEPRWTMWMSDGYDRPTCVRAHARSVIYAGLWAAFYDFSSFFLLAPRCRFNFSSLSLGGSSG